MCFWGCQIDIGFYQRDERNMFMFLEFGYKRFINGLVKVEPL